MHFENRRSLLCVPDNESMRIGNVGFRLIATLIYIFFIFLLLLSVYIFILECRFTFFVLRLVLLHAVLHVVSYRNRSRPRRLVHGRFFVCPESFRLDRVTDGLEMQTCFIYLFRIFLEDCIVDAQEKREMDITAIGWKKRNKVVTNEKKTIIKQ